MTMTTIDERPGGPPDTYPQNATPPAPTARHGRRGVRLLRTLRTFVVTVALFAAAAFGGIYVAQHRLQSQAYVNLGTAMLTAEAVPVGSPDAAVVSSVRVSEQQHVKAGQTLAVITLNAPAPSSSSSGSSSGSGGSANGSGTASGSGTTAGRAGAAGVTNAAAGITQTLRAPIDGTVASVDSAVGSVVKAGDPVVTLYDQSKLSFQAQVPVDLLKRLRLGMTASVDGPGLQHQIKATVARIVPRVGDGTLSGSDQLTVVLLPVASVKATVSTLLPGLPYNASVDTKTSTGGTPAVNSAG